jgi:hypothetical protein
MTIKLTAYRLQILREAAEERGSERPTGYRNAGPDAARWWNAVKTLSTEGLVRAPGAYGGYAYATDKGKAFLENHDAKRHAELALSPMGWALTCTAGDDYSYEARGMAPVMDGELERLQEVLAERGLELFGGDNGLHVERIESRFRG